MIAEPKSMPRYVKMHLLKSLFMAVVLLVQSHGASSSDLEATNFPVPNVAIQVGETLTENLIVERRLVANPIALRTHHSSREGVIGKVALKRLAAGAAIPLNALRSSHVFKEGERVTVEFLSGALSIRTVGVALQPGVIGGPVKVKNIDTGTIVTGVVRSDGIVEIRG